MNDLLGYPRDENVTDIDLGSHRASIVELTDENRQHMVDVCMSMYLFEHCKYCDREYLTLEDLKDTVYAGSHERGRLACKSCWDENNPPEVEGANPSD